MHRFDVDDSRVIKWPSLSNNVFISSLYQLSLLPLITTSITISSGVGNEVSIPITSLDFTRFIFLQQINIPNNSLNSIKKIITKGLHHLIDIHIGENSLNSIQEYNSLYRNNF